MGNNKKGSLADKINWGGKENDKKKKKKEESLLDKMKFYRNGGKSETTPKKVESVTVRSDSREGVEKGLDMAKKLLNKGEFAYGGKKMQNGGMKKSDALRKMSGKDKYSMPDDVKQAMKKALGSSASVSDKDEKDVYELPQEISDKMEKLKKSFLKRKKRK